MMRDAPVKLLNVFYPVYLSGVLLKTFEAHTGLYCHIYDITISDDGETLALACGNDGVRLYEITNTPP